jgi:hypothetical protein
MKAYIDLRKEHFEQYATTVHLHPPPDFLIHMPLRIGGYLGTADNVRPYRHRHIDLPGIKELSGDTNVALLEECRRGVIMVVMDASQVNNQKLVAQTLDELCAVVNKVDSHPRRMIFILNKMDVFKTQSRAAAGAMEFVEEARQLIEAKLRRHFGEDFLSRHDELTVIPMSALAGVLAQTLERSPASLQEDPELRTRVRSILSVIPDSEADQAMKELANRQIRRLPQWLFQHSGAPKLFEALHRTIQTEIPSIIIRPMVDEFLNGEGGTPHIQPAYEGGDGDGR